MSAFSQKTETMNTQEPHTIPFSPRAICRSAGLPLENAAAPWKTLQCAHNRYCALTHTLALRTAGGDVAAVWLDAGVEADVAAAWQHSPERAFWLHAVAQTVCMKLVAALVPEVVTLGCAPLPIPKPELLTALQNIGLSCTSGQTWLCERQYAVITPMPYVGGCEICALSATCPGPRLTV